MIRFTTFTLLLSVILTPKATLAQDATAKVEAPQQIKFILDIAEAPQAKDWGDKAMKDVVEWYPRIANLLASKDYSPPTEVTLRIALKGTDVAATSGNVISVSSTYIRGNPEDIGLAVHELVHVMQGYPQGSPWWVTEGIADYIRRAVYEGKPIGWFPKPNKPKGYEQGYGAAAGFLLWLESDRAPGIVRKLNASIRQGTYSEQIFMRETKRSLDDLWTTYVEESSVTQTHETGEQRGLVVVGYVPHYRMEKLHPEQVNGVTDLIYFGLVPTADGRFPDPAVEPGHLNKLSKLRESNDCRVLLSIGGWDRSRAFPELTNSDADRARFIANLLRFCRDHSFAGVDYDWEHPKDTAELARYTVLIAETKAAFSNAGLLVTVAQASWQDLGKDVYSIVDRIHLMSYDHDYPQATLAKTTTDVEKLIAWGCPPNKVAVGIPFYGRNKAGGTEAYQAIASQSGADPSTNNHDGFAFNGPAVVAAKCELARTRGLAGVMIWELGQDAIEKDNSLLSVIVQSTEVRK